MKFTIVFQHRRKSCIFLVTAEKDAIFIARPNWKEGRCETIFLTKAGEQWVGDHDDKKLVYKIGREIEAGLQAKRAAKKECRKK